MQEQRHQIVSFYKNLHCSLSPSSSSSSSSSLLGRIEHAECVSLSHTHTHSQTHDPLPKSLSGILHTQSTTTQQPKSKLVLGCTHMGTSSENAPEKVLWVDEQGSMQELMKDRPSLLRPRPLPASCFQTHSSTRGKSDEDLSPLLHENSELKAEQSSLLLRNSELLSRTLLLKLENQRLKEQLELQLRKTHLAVSSSVPSSGSSSLSEEDSSDSDNEEFLSNAVETGLSEVKLAPASDDTDSP